MLERLRISNFALIDAAELEFSTGLNVLTGETGTGKSILLGALSVLLGERITDDLFRSDAETLEVEANLTAQGLKLPDWIEAGEGMLLILRKAQKGKRAANFVNQGQTTQTALAELGNHLVDIHGQHQHQLLLKPSTHGRFLDAYGGLASLRDAYVKALTDYRKLLAGIKTLENDIAKRREQRDFLQFQFDEIAKLAPQKGETKTLYAERELLASAEQRVELANRLIGLISEQEASVLEGLALLSQMLKDLLVLDSSMEGLSSTIGHAEISTQEVWRELLSYRESIEYSPERLEEINERLFAFEKLCRKHEVNDEGLILLAEDIKTRLESIELDAEDLVKLQTEEGKLKKEVVSLAGELSAGREKTRKDFQQAVVDQLGGLAMPKAELVVDLVRTEDMKGLYEDNGIRYRLGEEGLEAIQFLFTANPGEAPKPLAKIASGGELSRIMLALKTVLVHSDQVPVLVFDEIDVGIGGRTAETVGKRLKELAASKQILLVTHLHQIARYADRHFRVTKEVASGKTFTRIDALDEKGRIDELARMLGGEEITDAVRAHAAELISDNQDD
jgi:DNA repair protein RecN (Recombination protein N)